MQPGCAEKVHDRASRSTFLRTLCKLASKLQPEPEPARPNGHISVACPMIETRLSGEGIRLYAATCSGRPEASRFGVSSKLPFEPNVLYRTCVCEGSTRRILHPELRSHEVPRLGA